MKKYLFLIVALGLATACTTQTSENTANADSLAVDSANVEATADAGPELPAPDADGSFGAAISAEGALPVAQVTKLLAKSDSARLTLIGNVNTACQEKGCWMTMPITDKQDLMIKFKDYGFFIPRECPGKDATISGMAYRELVSVEELRHYAEDEGRPKEEIEKITKPEERITFMADGVIIHPIPETAN
jgi:hypothetical protein